MTNEEKINLIGQKILLLSSNLDKYHNELANLKQQLEALQQGTSKQQNIVPPVVKVPEQKIEVIPEIKKEIPEVKIENPEIKTENTSPFDSALGDKLSVTAEKIVAEPLEISKKKLSFKEKLEYEQLEKEIANLEAEKLKITTLLNAGSDNHEDIMKWSEQIETLKCLLKFGQRQKFYLLQKQKHGA